MSSPPRALGPRQEESELDALWMMEDTFMEQGRQAGLERGQAEGLQDGRSMGVSKGMELSDEMGYYAGYAAALTAMLNRFGRFDKYSHQLGPSLDALERLAREFPLLDPLDETLQDKAERIRARHRKVASLLKVPGNVARVDGVSGWDDF
jgi:hypothetical protein